MSAEWIKDITIEELPWQYQEMAAIIGVESTLKLAQHYAKMPFYFISLECLITKKKEEYIRKSFTGNNHKEIARATGYSERWVYEILKNGKDERQCGFFSE